MPDASQGTGGWPRSALILPFAIALFAPLSLASQNVGEFGAGELALLVVGSLAFAGVLLALLFALPGRRSRPVNTVLIAAAILVWFFFAPMIEVPVISRLRELPGIGGYARFRYGVAMSLLVLTITVTWLWRRHREAMAVARFLTILAGVLVLSSTARLVLKAGQASGGAGEEPRSIAELAKPFVVDGARPPSTSDPDVYIFIVDQYANDRVLREHFGFSNGAFEERLQTLGFQIPREVHSNYAWTALSLASVLNAAHLTEVSREVGPHFRDFAVLYRLIQNNRTARYLKERGYRYYLFPSREFPGTLRSDLADETFRLSKVSAARRWLLASPLAMHLVGESSPGRLLTRFGYGPQVADYGLRVADAIESIAREPGPKLVFAHFMITHDPFYLGDDCRPSRKYTLALAQSSEPYRVAVDCANRMLDSLVTAIERDSQRPYAIVIQGDHGTQRSLAIGTVDAVSGEAAAERFGAFGAYFLPAGSPPMPDTVAAINVVPLLFQRLFGASMPLQEDRSFFSTLTLPFAFREFAGSGSQWQAVDPKSVKPFFTTGKNSQE